MDGMDGRLLLKWSTYYSKEHVTCHVLVTVNIKNTVRMTDEFSATTSTTHETARRAGINEGWIRPLRRITELAIRRDVSGSSPQSKGCEYVAATNLRVAEQSSEPDAPLAPMNRPPPTNLARSSLVVFLTFLRLQFCSRPPEPVLWLQPACVVGCFACSKRAAWASRDRGTPRSRATDSRAWVGARSLSVLQRLSSVLLSASLPLLHLVTGGLVEGGGLCASGTFHASVPVPCANMYRLQKYIASRWFVGRQLEESESLKTVQTSILD